MKKKSLKEKYPYNLLTEYFIDANNITEDTPYSIFEIDARELIVPERIDIMAKMEYIDFKVKNIDCDFAKELYIKHIEAFSNGTYTEPGTPEKNSINIYLKEFDQLIDKIKNEGFNPDISLIPLGKNNEILDGSHRTSISAYFNKKVTVIKFPTLSRNFDYNFFKERFLDQQYLDYLINKYCKLKENVYISCVCPRANDENYRMKIHNIIKDKCKIVCSKEVKLSYQGLRNFIIQIYGHKSWVRSYENNFSGVISKVDNCYKNNKNMIVYVLESNKFEDILELKQEIRKLLGIDNHSIHITDNQLKSIQMANLLFNNNSLQHLNTSVPDKYPNFNNKIKTYKQNIINNSLNINDFIIDSGGSMAVFGLRDCSDLDFLSVSSNQKIVEENDIEIHDILLPYYKINKDSMIYDPTNYFVYNDLKFITLDVLKDMKKKRNTKKDRKDVKLINKHLKSNNMLININMIALTNSINRRKRAVKQQVKNNIIYLSKKIGLY